MVTLLTDPLPELPDEPELEPDESLDWELLSLEVLLVDGEDDDVTVLADERLASAGSCPDTNTTAISSQAATNSATAPPTIRRRIRPARLSRAVLIAARAWAALGSLSVMFKYLVLESQEEAVGSFALAHLSRV